MAERSSSLPIRRTRWNPDPRRNRPQLAPYPLTLNDARITDENAPVTSLNRIIRC